MNFKILYLCAQCAQTVENGYTAVHLKTTDPPQMAPEPCEMCKRKCYGERYYIRKGTKPSK